MMLPRNGRWLRRNQSPAGNPPPAATGLSLAGFFFSLLKPVLGMGGQPAVRQQGLQA
jgi:hypothetical protein